MEHKSEIISFFSSSPSLSDWKSKISSNEFLLNFERYIFFLMEKLNQEEQYYYKYLRIIPEIVQDEDKLTSYFEILFNNVLTINQEWFGNLLQSTVYKISSEILHENIIIFLEEIHLKNNLTKKNRIIQILYNVDNIYFKNIFFLFLLEQNIRKYSLQDILQHFNKKSMILTQKLRLISIISNFEFEGFEHLEFAKNILHSKLWSNTSEIRLAIFIQNLEHINKIFNSYDEFISYISLIEFNNFHENLILEITKPEWINRAWILKLAIFYLFKSKYNTYFLEVCGEFIAAFPISLQQIIIELADIDDENIRKSLTNTISYLWWDQNLIIKLIHDKNKDVQLNIFQTIIPLFNNFSEDLKSEIALILKESHLKKLHGYFIGFYFDISIHSEIDIIELFKDNNEEFIAGLNLGLGYRWNDLSREIIEFFNKSIEKEFSKTLKLHLRTGLESYLGILNDGGLNILKKLKSLSDITADDILLL